MTEKLSIKTVELCIAGAILLSTGCSSNAAEGQTSAASKNSTAFAPEEAIKIEDIDWKVEDAVNDGERFLSFNYTNNSSYTIMDVELKYRQKEGITDAEYALFDNLKAENEYLIEDNKKLYIFAYNRKIADPGETVTTSPVVINGTGYTVENMDQYNLFEPDIMTVAIMGPDGKGYGIYYDYKSEKFSASSQGAQDLHAWSDSNLAKTLPDPDFTADAVSSDKDDYFYVYTYGISSQDYKDYIKAVQEKGFTDEKEEYSSSYHAKNSDGIEVSLYYDGIEESMSICVEKKS